MKNWNKKIVSFLLFFTIFCIGTIIYFSKLSSEKTVTYLSASWEYNYKDIEEISEASDFIALVKVDCIEDSFTDTGIPYTEFKVDIVTPIYNAEEGESVTILMTGGETKDEIIEIEDDPLLQPGDEILIFCQQNTNDTYRIISGPQGRLVYNNGELNSLNIVNERVKKANSSSNITIKNEDANELIRQVKKYTNKTHSK